MHKEMTFQFDAEVADWLAAQPEGGAAWIAARVREKLPAPVSAELSGDAKRALALAETLDASIRERVKGLIRYPQMVDAVARGYISVERAEEMAAEADARKG